MKELTDAQKIWIEDLETTEAKQGSGYLNKDNSFCCMGRACVMFDEMHPEAPLEKSENDSVIYYEHNGQLPPPTVVDWLGLKGTRGTYTNKHGVEGSLVYDNDRGMNFSEIAHIIKTYADQIFR